MDVWCFLIIEIVRTNNFGDAFNWICSDNLFQRRSIGIDVWCLLIIGIVRISTFGDYLLIGIVLTIGFRDCPITGIV